MVFTSLVNTSFETLHLDIIPASTRKALLCCAELTFLKNDGWYLAGGTALALQAGHRESLDLDFFAHTNAFDPGEVAGRLSKVGPWKTTMITEGTLYGELLGAKMSFIAYPYFVPQEPILECGSVRIITPLDIAPMKVMAISQRGRKRDFFDLYWLSRNILSLAECLSRMEKQYSVHQNMNHIFKSLVYFADAEEDPDPKVHFNANWNDVKSFFKVEATSVATRVLGIE